MLKYAIPVGVATLAAAYVERRLRANTDRVVFCEPRQDDKRGKLARHIVNILRADPSLRNIDYSPPFWIFNSWINVFVFMVKLRWTKYRDRDELLRTHVVAPDGARLYVDWLKNDSLPENAPLLLILPTITGDGPTHSYIMKEASRRGFRACVLNRRGLADTLDTPQFNMMGNQDDTVLQVSHIKNKYTKACFTGLMGLSGGSGLLVNYLGSTRTKEIDAACCLCPAYDIETAFQNFSQRNPIVDGYLFNEVLNRFVLSNEKLLREYNSEAVDACINAKSVDGILRAHVPFTGYDSEKSYFIRSNPMQHMFGIRCPLMILNADDDMVCLKRNIREDIPRNHGGALMLRTSEGSHVAFSEGMLGEGNFMIRKSLDFLDAARKFGARAEFLPGDDDCF